MYQNLFNVSSNSTLPLGQVNNADFMVNANILFSFILRFSVKNMFPETWGWLLCYVLISCNWLVFLMIEDSSVYNRIWHQREGASVARPHRSQPRFAQLLTLQPPPLASPFASLRSTHGDLRANVKYDYIHYSAPLRPITQLLTLQVNIKSSFLYYLVITQTQGYSHYIQGILTILFK